MNKISAKQIMSFGRNILSIFIDDKPLSEIVSAKLGDPLYKDLRCAWLVKKNCEPWEQHGNYIWTLLDAKCNCNIPILLCPDDMDFWCTIIVAQVHFYDDTVVWKKIGLETGKCDTKHWNKSGIKNLESWSENDWELYGSTLAPLAVDDKAWDDWCSKNWIDEENRRLWNYFHPYLNNDRNFQWLDLDQLSFHSNDYSACVSEFKDFIIQRAL